MWAAGRAVKRRVRGSPPFSFPPPITTTHPWNYANLLGCFVLMLGGISLLQFNSIHFRKIGMAMIWLASGLVAYFLSNSLLLAGAMLLAWIFFPIWEMVFVLRQLRVPRHRELADARAPRDEFEDLGEITHELVELGFEQLDECCLQPAQHEQYYQILMRGDNLIQATIGFVAQGAIGFHFIAFTSYTARMSGAG